MKVVIYKRKNGCKAVLWGKFGTKKEAKKELATKWMNIIESDEYLTENDGLFLNGTSLRYNFYNWFIESDKNY